MKAAAGGFTVHDFEPAYRAPGVLESLRHRAAAARETLRECRVCPRQCGVDRLAGEVEYCHTGRHARVSSAFPHRGEEDCLRGERGSGTIFFGRCNLRCVFCQNWDISQTDAGSEVSARKIAELMLGLEARGCHNINFVTPEHVVPQVIEAIAMAVECDLSIPIVYNTSAYDSLESIESLEGLVDIYMPDFKLWSPGACGRYLGARDYGERAREAIAAMHRQVGDLCTTSDGIACRGVLVRHLVMPGLLDESAQILAWLAEEISPDTYLNIMSQYRPEHRVGTTVRAQDGRLRVRHEEIDRLPAIGELERAYHLAQDAGLWRFAGR
ncbi:MAG: radical SAM protein [Planctomycetota bacterium]